MPSELREALNAATASALVPKIIDPLLLEYQRRYSPVVRAVPSVRWDADSYYFNQRTANATGGFTLLRQLGGSLGIAILTTLLVHETAIAWNVLASGVTQTHGYSTGQLTQMVAQQSAMIGYNFLFRLTAIVFVLSTPLVFLIKGKPAHRAMAAAVE